MMSSICKTSSLFLFLSVRDVEARLVRDGMRKLWARFVRGGAREAAEEPELANFKKKEDRVDDIEEIRVLAADPEDQVVEKKSEDHDGEWAPAWTPYDAWVKTFYELEDRVISEIQNDSNLATVGRVSSRLETYTPVIENSVINVINDIVVDAAEPDEEYVNAQWLWVPALRNALDPKTLSIRYSGGQEQNEKLTPQKLLMHIVLRNHIIKTLMEMSLPTRGYTDFNNHLLELAAAWRVWYFQRNDESDAGEITKAKDLLLANIDIQLEKSIDNEMSLLSELREVHNISFRDH